MHMIDFAYDNFAYLFGTLNQQWLAPENLSQFAAAVHEKGAALEIAGGLLTVIRCIYVMCACP